MITTFFGRESFGGDAAYVERLSMALARRGHEVEVVHSADAFDVVRGDHPLRSYRAPPGVQVHTLRSSLGALSPLWTHQTGRLGPGLRPLKRILERHRFDVVHFHNISLIGPAVLSLAERERPVKLMTVHDYWLVCPTHLLWKLDRRVCERPQCLRCTVNAHRPPQLWRHTPLLDRSLEQLDAVICPSRHSASIHRERGVRAPIVELPYHLPRDWSAPAEPTRRRRRHRRPYFAAAGRLVKEKGFQRVIPLMRELPEVDLRVAGAGPYEAKLRKLAGGMANVHFEGLLSHSQLAELFRAARALIVPSLFWETFGYVVIEAFSTGTPAIVSRRGALPELIDATGGGVTFDSDRELLTAIRALAWDDSLRARLGGRGRRGVEGLWSEEAHLDRYLGLVAQGSRGGPRAAGASSVGPGGQQLVV